MTRPPHYLRVVQALALVSGFGAVAVVGGAALAGCGSETTSFHGVACPAEGCGADATPTPVFNTDGGGLLSFDAMGVGADDSGTVCAPCFPGDAGADTVADATMDAATADAPDAAIDATTDGGPLPPPDLPV